MQLDQLRSYLGLPRYGAAGAARLESPRSGTRWRNLTHLASSLSLDPLRELCGPLSRLLPRCPDPDMALNNLERFLANPAGRRAVAAPARKPRTARWKSCCNCSAPANRSAICSVSIPITSTCSACRCGAVPASPNCARRSQTEVDAAFEDSAVLRDLSPLPPAATAAHRHQRHHPRTAARRNHARHVARRRRRPRSRPGHRPAARRQALRRAVHHGGQARVVRRPGVRQARRRGTQLQQRHRPDVRLRRGGATRGKRITSIGNDEFFGRVVGEVVRLLSAHTDRGQAYRVDLRLRPEGGAARWRVRWPAPCPITIRWAARGSGRRSSSCGPSPATGSWASSFLQAIEPFVYRKYLSFAEINEIKAMKRQDRAESQPGRRQRHARSKPDTAASATSNSRFSFCNCSTAAICRRCASATPCWPCRPSSASAA